MSEPNLRLIIKLLNMTTSANDAEALIAMRKANEAVRAAQWDWDRLLSGKVTIVEDPFSRIPEPEIKPSRASMNGQAPTAPARPESPQPTWSQPSTFSQAPRRPGTSSRAPSGPDLNPFNNINAHSTRPNQFTGHCWHCGLFVNGGDGWILKKRPDQRQNSPKGGEFLTLCSPCNAAGAILRATPARKAKVSTSDIFNSV